MKCGVSDKTVAAVGVTSEIPKGSVVQTADGRMMEISKIARKAAEPATRVPVEPFAIRLVEVSLRPAAKVPMNDDPAAIVTPANDDAEDVPDARLVAELDATGATVVRLLAALAMAHPGAAHVH